MKSIYFLILILLVFYNCSNKNKKNPNTGNIEILEHGSTLLKLNEKSVAIFISSQKFLTKEADSLNSKSLEYSIIGDFVEANALLNEALIIEPENATLLNNLGNIALNNTEYPLAIDYYSKALQVSDSSSIIPAANLGKAHFHNRNFHESIEISKWAISKTDDQSVLILAYFNLAVSYIGLNDCKNAALNYRVLKEKFIDVKGIESFLIKINSTLEKMCLPYPTSQSLGSSRVTTILQASGRARKSKTPH